MYTHHILCSDGDELDFIPRSGTIYPRKDMESLGYIAPSFHLKYPYEGIDKEELKTEWCYSVKEPVEHWSLWHCRIASQYGRYFSLLLGDDGYEAYKSWAKDREVS